MPSRFLGQYVYLVDLLERCQPEKGITMKHMLVPACRRTALLLVALIALSLSLLVAPLAFAATVPTSAHPAAQVRPQASGGGCNTDIVEACISENSFSQVVSDAYAAGNTLCNVDVTLFEASTSDYVNDYNYSGCYASGHHFAGPVWYVTPGYSWFTFVCANVGNPSGYQDCNWSPTQYS